MSSSISTKGESAMCPAFSQLVTLLSYVHFIVWWHRLFDGLKKGNDIFRVSGFFLFLRWKPRAPTKQSGAQTHSF